MKRRQWLSVTVAHRSAEPIARGSLAGVQAAVRRQRLFHGSTRGEPAYSCGGQAHRDLHPHGDGSTSESLPDPATYRHGWCPGELSGAIPTKCTTFPTSEDPERLSRRDRLSTHWRTVHELFQRTFGSRLCVVFAEANGPAPGDATSTLSASAVRCTSRPLDIPHAATPAESHQLLSGHGAKIPRGRARFNIEFDEHYAHRRLERPLRRAANRPPITAHQGTD